MRLFRRHTLRKVQTLLSLLAAVLTLALALPGTRAGTMSLLLSPPAAGERSLEQDLAWTCSLHPESPGNTDSGKGRSSPAGQHDCCTLGGCGVFAWVVPFARPLPGRLLPGHALALPQEQRQASLALPAFRARGPPSVTMTV